MSYVPTLLFCSSTLRLQKRLAAAVMKCGKNKVWFDPNETNEIANANSRKLLLSCTEVGPQSLSCLLTYLLLNQVRTSGNWLRMALLSVSQLSSTQDGVLDVTLLPAGKVVILDLVKEEVLLTPVCLSR